MERIKDNWKEGENWGSDDVIAGMFGFLEGEYFTSQPLKIHQALFALKEKHPQLLTEFVFTIDDLPRRWSPLMERVMNRLRLSGIWDYTGDFEACRVGPKWKENCSELALKHFNEEHKRELKEMAAEFEEMCGVPDPFV